MKKLLALGGIATLVSLHAISSTVYVLEPCISASIGAEAIYWKPCAQPVVVAGKSPIINDTRISEIFTVNPDYDWGFRVFGSVGDACDQSTLMLGWTYLHTSTSAKSDGQIDVMFNLGFANTRLVDSFKAKTTFRYNNVTLRGSHLFCSSCRNRLYGYLGGRYVYIRRTDTWTGIEPTSNIFLANRQFAKVSAGGIEAGLAMDLDIVCGFFFHAEAGIGGFVGRQEYNGRSTTTTAAPPLNNIPFQNDNSSTICFAGLDAKLSFGWQTECSCFDIRGEIGYETNYYLNPIQAALPNNPNSFLEFIDVGFSGLFFGLSAGF